MLVSWGMAPPKPRRCFLPCQVRQSSQNQGIGALCSHKSKFTKCPTGRCILLFPRLPLSWAVYMGVYMCGGWVRVVFPHKALSPCLCLLLVVIAFPVLNITHSLFFTYSSLYHLSKGFKQRSDIILFAPTNQQTISLWLLFFLAFFLFCLSLSPTSPHRTSGPCLWTSL